MVACFSTTLPERVHIVVFTWNNNTLKAAPLDCSVNQDHNSSQASALPHPLYVKNLNPTWTTFVKVCRISQIGDKMSIKSGETEKFPTSVLPLGCLSIVFQLLGFLMMGLRNGSSSSSCSGHRTVTCCVFFFTSLKCRHSLKGFKHTTWGHSV